MYIAPPRPGGPGAAMPFSIFGAIVMSDWRKSLGELARVVRRGGNGCVASWRDPPGGGPFVLMAQALRSTFPDRPMPRDPEGMRALSSPDRLRQEMQAAGFERIDIQAVEGTWTGPTGEGYLAATEDLYSYIPLYAQLSECDRDLVRARAAGRRRPGDPGGRHEGAVRRPLRCRHGDSGVKDATRKVKYPRDPFVNNVPPGPPCPPPSNSPPRRKRWASAT